MENAMILNTLAPKELEELIKKVVEKELDELKENFSSEIQMSYLLEQQLVCC